MRESQSIVAISASKNLGESKRLLNFETNGNVPKPVDLPPADLSASTKFTHIIHTRISRPQLRNYQQRHM